LIALDRTIRNAFVARCLADIAQFEKYGTLGVEVVFVDIYLFTLLKNWIWSKVFVGHIREALTRRGNRVGADMDGICKHLPASNFFLDRMHTSVLVGRIRFAFVLLNNEL